MTTLQVVLRWKNELDDQDEWMWAIMEGHDREAARLAAADASDDPKRRALLAAAYRELICDLIDGPGRRRRLDHLADEFAKRYCPMMSRLIGFDVEPTKIGYDAEAVLIRLTTRHAERLRRWLIGADGGERTAFAHLTCRAFQTMLAENVFAPAVWKAANRLIFEAKARDIRRVLAEAVG
jgi:hypothetical protein